MGTFKNLDRLLDSFTQGSIPGCACVVMQNHDILYESYSGFADIEKGTKINERSIFRQASTTKLFTYAIGMMLFEEGRSVSRIRYMISCRNGKILPNMCRFRGAQPRWFLWSIPLL